MFASALRILGAVPILFGFIMIVGSANDCDGACMEQANSIGQMLMVIGYGVVLILGGSACIKASSYFE